MDISGGESSRGAMARLKPARVDLKAQLKFLYTPSSKEVQVVDVPKMSFLMVDGAGDPGAQPFQTAVQTLYSLAYTVKFGLKRERVEFPVMALEGLWSSGGSPIDFESMARDTWRWTLMIVQPEVVTSDVVARLRTRSGRRASRSFRFGLKSSARASLPRSCTSARTLPSWPRSRRSTTSWR